MELKKTGKRWGQQASNLSTEQLRDALETLKVANYEVSTGGGSKLPEGTFIEATITSFTVIGNDSLKQSLIVAQIEYVQGNKTVKDSATIADFNEVAVGDSIYIECRMGNSGLRNRQVSEEVYEAGFEAMQDDSEGVDAKTVKLTLADMPKNLNAKQRAEWLAVNDVTA